MPSTSLHFLFGDPLPASTHFLFGDATGPSVVEVQVAALLPCPSVRIRIAPLSEVSVQVQLPPPVASVQLRPSMPVQVAALLPNLSVQAVLQYNSNTQRPTVGQTVAAWVMPQAAQTGAALPQQNTSYHSAQAISAWQSTQARHHAQGHPLPPSLLSSPVALAARHQDALGQHLGTGFVQQAAVRYAQQRTDRHQDAHPLPSATGFRHQDGDRTKRQSRAVRYQQTQPLHRPQLGRSQVAQPFPKGWRARHQDARVPPIGITVRPVIPPKPPIVPDTDFEFGDGIIVTPKRAYIVINAITLARLDTGATLHALGFSASLDYGSWTWQWSATLHESAQAHLDRQPNGDPPELLASINGQLLRLTLERTRLNQEFLPQKRYQVSGRGRAAILASPWAPTMQHGGQLDARTAQQLANEVLTINGVGIGWSVDWQLPDWTVPAGLWAVQGSYIDALTDIAGAVGAYIQPHPTDVVLRILPKYPAPPWQWGDLTPDYELPLDAVQTLGTEFIDKPAYTGIYIGGVQAGVFGPVVRAGTLGSELAPQITHPLITDATAQRLRGIAELSDTGKQRRVSLSMQVLPETGLIMPGQLLQVGSGSNAMRGIVRGTSIEWGRPKLRQNLELEVHA